MYQFKKTIFIVGISSYVGSNLAEVFKDRYRIIGSYYENPVEIDGVTAVRCDVNDKEMVRRLIYIFKPDYTIYAAGLTSLNTCQEFPELSEALNTAGIFNVSSATERYSSRLIYISSSYIFSGEDEEFVEDDSPTPSSVYGNSIASAEFYIQKSCLNYLIFRSCPLVGRTLNKKDFSFLEGIERNNIYNEKIVCDNAVHTGFLDFYTLAHVIDKALRAGITNEVFNLSSTDLMTRFQLATAFSKVFGLNDNLLVKGDWRFPRTENTIALQGLGEELYFKVSTKKVETMLGYKPPNIEEVLMRFKRSVEKGLEIRESKKTGGINYI